MTNSSNDPGSRIKRIRKGKGITQRELSDQLGVTENTIANWEKGSSINQWLSRIQNLCKVLGCTFEELVGGGAGEDPELSGESLESILQPLNKDDGKDGVRSVKHSNYSETVTENSIQGDPL